MLETSSDVLPTKPAPTRLEDTHMFMDFLVWSERSKRRFKLLYHRNKFLYSRSEQIASVAVLFKK